MTADNLAEIQHAYPRCWRCGWWKGCGENPVLGKCQYATKPTALVLVPEGNTLYTTAYFGCVEWVDKARTTETSTSQTEAA